MFKLEGEMTVQRACTGAQGLLGKGWSRQCSASRFPGENRGEVHTGGLGCPLFGDQAQDPESG